MDKGIKRILEDIPTLDDEKLDEVGMMYRTVYDTYRKDLGDKAKKTQEAKVILDALIDESWKREARATYKKLPDTFNELMGMILAGEENIHGLSKEEVHNV